MSFKTVILVDKPLKEPLAFQMGVKICRVLFGLSRVPHSRIRVYLDGRLCHQTKHEVVRVRKGRQGFSDSPDYINPVWLPRIGPFRPTLESWAIDHEGWLCAVLTSASNVWPTATLQRLSKPVKAAVEAKPVKEAEEAAEAAVGAGNADFIAAAAGAAAGQDGIEGGGSGTADVVAAAGQVDTAGNADVLAAALRCLDDGWDPGERSRSPGIMERQERQQKLDTALLERQQMQHLLQDRDTASLERQQMQLLLDTASLERQQMQ